MGFGGEAIELVLTSPSSLLRSYTGHCFAQVDGASCGYATRSPSGAKRGGGYRDRTCDLLNANQALYQLS